MKELRKTEKEKKKRKIQNGPRDSESAQSRMQPAAHLLISESVPLFYFPLTDAWTPLSGSSSSSDFPARDHRVQ
jgi:hypothetical protein